MILPNIIQQQAIANNKILSVFIFFMNAIIE